MRTIYYEYEIFLIQSSARMQTNVILAGKSDSCRQMLEVLSFCYWERTQLVCYTAVFSVVTQCYFPLTQH